MRDENEAGKKQNASTTYDDLIGRWEDMTDKKRRQNLEEDIYHAAMSEAWVLLRKALAALPENLHRADVEAALAAFAAPDPGLWKPFLYVDASDEDGILIEVRVFTPDNFRRDDDYAGFDHRGRDMLRAAWIRVPTI